MSKNEMIELLRSLNPTAVEKYKAKLVGLFGSFSRGEEKRDSDVDILVDFQHGADLVDCAGLVLFLENEIGLKVDVVPRASIRQEIRDVILKEAVYL